MSLSELREMTKSFKEWLETKHLPGYHDQSTHGNWSQGRMAQQATDKGGFTYQPLTHDHPVTGFALSIMPEHEQVENFIGVQKSVIAGKIADYIKSKSAQLADPKVHVGAWWNKEGDGKLYLDLSVIVPTKEEAMTLGKQHGQMSAFDLANKTDLPIMSQEEHDAWKPDAAAPMATAAYGGKIYAK